MEDREDAKFKAEIASIMDNVDSILRTIENNDILFKRKNTKNKES